MRRPGRFIAGAIVAGSFLLAPAIASAGEVGAFLTAPTPSKDWKTSFGFHAAILSLPFLQAGGEFARIKGEDEKNTIETYTGQVEFSPPALKISPFVGLGVGAYRKKEGNLSDWGSLNAVFGGVRVPFGMANLRAEFRKTSLSGSPKPNVDKRFSLGLSLRF